MDQARGVDVRADTVPVGQVDEVSVGEMKPLEIAGRRMILANIGDGYRVFARECPHEWVDLLEGEVSDDDTVRCAQHGYEFDLTSGECITPVAWCPALTVLPTEVDGSQIYVRIDTPTG
jgi:nitrite reductase/ring-hydroxylating ferredoxin subunit